MRNRGFEAVSAYAAAGLRLPERKTRDSAGYDMEAAETIILQPGTVTLVPTGIKAYMPTDEYLGIHIRSGLAVRQTLMLANGQGIIDSDYYNNTGNEGHIMIALLNYGAEKITITKGERIAQAIFYKYLVADGDASDASRGGGFGSTGR